MLDLLQANSGSRNDENMLTSSDARASRETVQAMVRELRDLAARYRVIAQREQKLLRPEELVDVCWIIALASPYRHEIDAQITDLP